MDSDLHTDDALLKKLGQRLAARRIALGLTQEKLSTEAGVSKRTVERIESGNSAEIVTWIRLLRVVGLLDGVEHLIPEPAPSPMGLLGAAKKTAVRKRAPRKRRGKGDAKPVTKPWTWGDDA